MNALRTAITLTCAFIYLSTGTAHAGPNAGATLPLHAVIGSGGCNIDDPCDPGPPTVNVPGGSTITAYLLLRNHDNVAGVQTAFDWSGWTFVVGEWSCQSNQLVAFAPQGQGGPTDGTIATAFDCVTGPETTVIGYMNLVASQDGCLTQIESSFPFGTHVVSCGDFVADAITPGNRGSICVDAGGVDACEPIGFSPPVCDADGPYTGTTGVAVTFNGTGSFDPDGTIETFAWQFGDGLIGFGPMPAHVYGQGGVYDVTLCVTDNTGLTTCCATTATINVRPICDAGGPYVVRVDTPLTFDGTGSTDPDGSIVDYAWDFGDGTTGSGPTPTHTYTTAPAVFNAQLTVTDDQGATSTCTAQVNVLPNILPTCDAGGPYSALVGEVIAFDGTGSNDPDGSIVDYAWEFGDGGVGSGPTPTHVYDTIGFFIVTLAVTDNDGATSSCATTASILSLPPICDAGGPYAGNVCAQITFDGSGSSDPDGMIVAWDWEFGDGAIGSGEIVSHAYASGGVFTVTLTVTDDGSQFSSCTTTADVDASNPPLPLTPIIGVSPVELDFGVVVVGDCAELPLLLFNDVNDACSELIVDQLNVAGAGFSLVNPPTLPLVLRGDGSPFELTVRFCPDGSGATSGTLDIVAMNAANSPLVVPLSGAGNLEPICDAGGPYFSDPFGVVQFDGTGSSDPDGTIALYAWDFGDGATGTGPQPEHMYQVGGVFVVTLCVTDDSDGTSCCETEAFVDFGSPVALTRFEATVGDGSVLLEWTASFEWAHQRFDLLRGTGSSGDFQRLNDRAIEPVSADGRRYRFVDGRVAAGTTYRYVLESIDALGGRERSEPLSVEVAPVSPQRFALDQNRPNPFNPSTVIRFELPASGRVALRLYDSRGRLVRVLVDERRAAGSQAVSWNGTDQSGRQVGSGVYIYQLESPFGTLTRRMVLVR